MRATSILSSRVVGQKQAVGRVGFSLSGDINQRRGRKERLSVTDTPFKASRARAGKACHPLDQVLLGGA